VELQVRPSVGALIRWMSERVRSGKKFFAGMIGVMTAAVVGSVAFGHGRTTVVLLLVAGGLGIVLTALLVAAVLYFLTTCLYLREDQLELRTFGSRREWPRPALARVARCAIRSPMA
jgi:hypothetical protein